NTTGQTISGQFVFSVAKKFNERSRGSQECYRQPKPGHEPMLTHGKRSSRGIMLQQGACRMRYLVSLSLLLLVVSSALAQSPLSKNQAKAAKTLNQHSWSPDAWGIISLAA